MELSNPTTKFSDKRITAFLKNVTFQSIFHGALSGEFSQVLELIAIIRFFGGPTVIPEEPQIKNLISDPHKNSKITLLHCAALHNNLQILKWLLEVPEWCIENDIEISSLGKRRDYVKKQDCCGYTALHLAILNDHKDIVKALVNDRDASYSINVAAGTMRSCKAHGVHRMRGLPAIILNGLTPLHLAARIGSLPIIQELLQAVEDKQFSDVLSARSQSLKTVLHYAAEYCDWEVMKYLLNQVNNCGKGDIVNQCDVHRQTPLIIAVSQLKVEVVEVLLREAQGLKLNTVTWKGITALDIVKLKETESSGKETRLQRLIDMLESYDVTWLQSERSKYANAANSLLVGAALIAGITYAGWLQPPLGLTQYSEFPTSGAPPGNFDSYAGVEQYWPIQLFWFFNSMAFFCSIATFIVGADAGIPSKSASLRDEVVQLRKSVLWASIILSVGILFVMGAFSSAGIIVLPPIQRQRAPMYVTVIVGVTVCLPLMMMFFQKLLRWFFSSSLQYQDPTILPRGESEEMQHQEAVNRPQRKSQKMRYQKAVEELERMCTPRM